MKYIEKHPEAAEVIAFEAELRDNSLDKESLSDKTMRPALGGSDVYEEVRSFPTFKGLKDRMFSDQGGICCYCGCRLQYPNHPQYIVEHVFPKEKDRTLASEYENLLLSCRPSNEEEHERAMVPKKERKKFFHCDKAKGSKVISITPLQQDCQDSFLYDEFGGVDGIDDKSREVALEILNLNCKWLRVRREAAIEGEIYGDDGELLSDDVLRQRLSTVMDRDVDGNYTEFCFFIQKAIEKLLI